MRVLIPTDAELPLIGCIQFGLIDRGANLIQVRPISGCNLNCIYCSVDEGPRSTTRVTSYLVELDYLVDWFRELAKFKGNKIEAHIDGAGEPTLYPWLVDLVQELADVKNVEVVSIQTNGTLLNEEKVRELAEAGLSRMNLSINALDLKLARELAGSDWYNIKKVTEVAKQVENSRIHLLVAPVWVPGINECEIPKIVKFVRELAKKEGKWPILGIQKYESHKYGRKPKGVREISWRKFYKQLEIWEKRLGIRLRISRSDFGIHATRMLPVVFKRWERVKVRVVARGWMRDEVIGIAKGRCITVVGCRANPGDLVNTRILKVKHNIYVARRV